MNCFVAFKRKLTDCASEISAQTSDRCRNLFWKKVNRTGFPTALVHSNQPGRWRNRHCFGQP
jgi:hypothetical protein